MSKKSPDSASSGGPTDDTGLLANLAKDAKIIKDAMPKFDPAELIRGFNPQDDPMRSSKPPKGTESADDIKLDNLRGAQCSTMMASYAARPWNDLCGGRILSPAYNFGAATTGAEDIVPFCGRESARECGQSIPAAAQEAGGPSDSAEAIFDCDLAAWRSSCLLGTSGQFNADPKDVSYNQRLYGLVPSECYCACYLACTQGQQAVLGAQRMGAGCTLEDLKAGRCKNHQSR